MAKKIRTQGTRALSVEIDETLRDYLDGYCGTRTETKRQVLERALRREFTDPPPVEEPPALPPLKPAPGRKKRG